MIKKPAKIKPVPIRTQGKLKIVVVGDGGSGKTSICDRYCSNTFEEKHVPTLGVDYKNKLLRISNDTISINFWDFAGYPEFVDLRNEFYKEAHAVLLVFDITFRKSFESLDLWVKEATKYGGPNVLFFLVGNKKDFQSTRVVSEVDSVGWAKKKGVKYHEVSAKTGAGIEELLDDVLRTLNL